MHAQQQNKERDLRWRFWYLMVESGTRELSVVWIVVLG
jgi:hypothetical protein